MKIEHIALWVEDLEKIKTFYEKYFGAVSNEKYHNPTKNFQSYFLSFESGSRLEIMNRPDILNSDTFDKSKRMGFTHLAISVGSKVKVDQLTEELRKGGYSIVSEPRTTGDGYYESLILDPENNSIEITV
ncbi:VOC family protein [Chryseobacterium sp.]|uniref:VOC family protein n=1 Tax=Chryseobacterium sp. TaxID=1871047 RepID=UPI0025C3B0D8|nr:VOC family protein [Chryseobacterium sp.]